MPCHRVLLPLLFFSFAVTACGSTGGQTSSSSASPTTVKAQAGGLSSQVASSDLAVGRQRFTFGLIDNNHPISVPKASVTFFLLHGQRGTAVERRSALFNYYSRHLPNTAADSAAVALKGVYVVYPSFPTAGKWLITAQFDNKGQSRYVQSASFDVVKKSLTPSVGSAAPRSHNPTVAQEPATKLDSGRPPDDMHKLSIAAAIAQHKPLVVVFSTPAFCTSRLCGPETQIVEGVENQYRGRVNFIHIEIYKDANPAHGFAPTVVQWHLLTEPWVFVINRKGVIAAKFEGPTTASEIASAINPTLH